MVYNKSTKEYVFSVGQRYLLFNYSPTKWALPFYYATHWSGLRKESYNISRHFSVLCFHFELNFSGPTIKDPDGYNGGFGWYRQAMRYKGARVD